MIDGFGSDTHLWLWVPAFAGTTTEWRGTDSNFKQPITDTPPRSRRAGARVLSATSRHLNQRAQGMPGARSARSRAWCVVNTRVSHHGHAGITRHSPRNGFNGFLRALPGDRACLPPSSAKIAFRELDASVGASGPHDFAVRKSTVRHRRVHVHRILTRVRDDREPPL